MLNINDYKYIKMLYEQFFNFNKYLKKLFESNDWYGVESALKQKDDLIRKIIFFEKAHKEEILENNELLDFKKKLIELEKENITLVTNLREQARLEMLKVSKSKKVLNTYFEQQETSTFDISCDD